jgi:hypothetical protein
LAKRVIRPEIREVLDAEIGDGKEIIAQLKKIAMGQVICVESDIPGSLGKRLTPTVSEMHTACMDLLAYKFGRPRQAVEVTQTQERKRYNPDLLSLQELEDLERIAKKAQLPAGEVIDTTPLCPTCARVPNDARECKDPFHVRFA